LKWIGIVVLVLVVAAFIGFLYFIPPLTSIPQEEFIKPMLAAGPSLDDIADPAERALAKRGRYLVTSIDCSGCHTPFGEEGPNLDEYLAGGNKSLFAEYGSFVTRNLTSDKTTGLGRRSDAEVLRILRTGLLPEGRVAHNMDMPWAIGSNMTEEDRYAILVYLRHVKAVVHPIPDPDPNEKATEPGSIQSMYGKDFGHPAK
jgi:mono/diheme cytochrome c family protein